MTSIMREEKGLALPLALMALAAGALLITPFLNSVSTSVLASRKERTSIFEQYAADAGIEDARWNLTYGDLAATAVPTQGDTTAYTLGQPVNGSAPSIAVTRVQDIYEVISSAGGVTTQKNMSVWTVLTPAQDLPNLSDVLQGIVDSNPGTSLADKVEDVISGVQDAITELAKTPPDRKAAVGNIEGAVGDLEAAVNEGLDPAQGTQLMDQLAGTARQLAVEALDQANAQGGDPVKINEAQQKLAEGDALRALGEFKDAVNKYKDAVDKAEDALS